MGEHRIGIIMNGVTGRMGTNQHLVRSILAIREQGGVRVASGETVMPDPVLVGRNEDKWECFLEHVLRDEPFQWSLLEGAKGVQLAEKAIESWRTRRSVDIDPLEV